MKENPFLKDGTVLSIASMNKLEIFYHDRWYFLNELLSKSEFVIEKSGQLAEVFFLLIKELKGNHQYLRRLEWNDEHWKTWQQLECFYLCGGNMKTPAGLEMIRQVRGMLEEENLNVELIVSEHPGQASIVGGGKFLSLMGKEGLLFDFGHTGIKRGYVKKTGINEYQIDSLPWIESRHVGWDYTDVSEAQKLHEYFVEIILDTLKEHPIDQELDLFISIANYVVAGEVIQRGGYGKLSLLAENYQDYLSDELKKICQKEVKVWLCHDTTAASFEAETLKNTAVLSFGTSMGVSFVQKEIQSSICQHQFNISKNII